MLNTTVSAGHEQVYLKLKNVLGPERANALLHSTLQQLQLAELRTPDDRLRFGEILIGRGGVFAAMGRSIKIQAILHGAREIQ